LGRNSPEFDTRGSIRYSAILDHVMKTGLRKFFFGRKNRWIPLLVFVMGFGIQIAGKWLPTLVICYKANERPKIEFLNDVCDCRKECNNYSLSGPDDGRARLQSSCRDVPLIADVACGLLPTPFSRQDYRRNPTVELFAAPILPFLFSRQAELGCLPPWSKRIDNDSGHVLCPGGVTSLLCRYLC
jgi:hypothetical protein